MFVYQAVGDAYGAAFEFLNHQRFHTNDGATYYVQPDTRLGAGRYTDDTQMSIALAEVMLDHKVRDITGLKIADAFVSAYQRDPRPGYATGFQNFLNTCSDGADLIARIRPDSTRSGAIMRAPCVGALDNIDDVLWLSELQASITHDTPEGIIASQAMSLAFHYVAKRLGKKTELRAFLNDILGTETYDWSKPRMTWATIEALDCAGSALDAYINSPTATETLKASIFFGGDTDSVASVAMCLAWADASMPNDLDPNLIEGLENDDYGFQYLLDLSNSFTEKFLK